MVRVCADAKVRDEPMIPMTPGTASAIEAP